MNDPSRFEWLEKRIDRLIAPQVFSKSTEDIRRARLAVGSCVVATVLFGVAMVVQGHYPLLLAVNGLSAIMCLATLLIVRFSGQVVVAANTVMAAAFCKYLCVAFLLRGAGLSGATVLLAQLPLIATLLLGIRTGIVWATLSILANFGIAALGRSGFIVDHLPADAKLLNDHFILLVSTCILFTAGALYERTKNAALRENAELEAKRSATEVERVKALAQAQLAEAERLGALGRIAAATAHEINNPLTFVANNLQILAKAISATTAPDLTLALSDALAGAERIRRIVTNMSLCARSGDKKLVAVNVGNAIETALQMAQPQIHARAQVERKIAPSLPAALGDEAELVQVLVNLLVNAAQAIAEGQPADNQIAIEAQASDGRVVVEVRDSGQGIPAELLNRVREPFFTTKPIGEGTGLGLALCDSVVTSFGGALTLQSQPGRTVAQIVLLQAKEQPAAQPVPAAVGAAPSSGLKILIVDDEEMIARVLKRLLSPHLVKVAIGGRQALDILEAEANFDLIFCDMMMPGLTGMDVFARVNAMNPALAGRVVFMSGGTYTEQATAFRKTVANTFIEKPFALSIITRLVAEHSPS